MRWIMTALLLQIALSACARECGSCFLDSNPYSCTTCAQSNDLVYLSSCPSHDQSFIPFIAVTVIITALHVAMLGLGIGVYRQMFQNIQLLSLITWRYGFERGAFALQGTNFTIVRNNLFADIFGLQFSAIIIVLLTFGLIMVSLGKGSQHPTAILFRRKRIIFPVRVMTLFYNIVLFASLAQISTIAAAPISAFGLGVTVCGIVFAVSTLAFTGVISNWKFQVDDPHYYVLVEQMVNKRWYSKNNLFINLVLRTCVIVSFVFLFRSPGVAGAIVLVLQISYTVYFVVCIRFVKIRYFVVLSTNLLTTIGIVFSIYIGASQTIGTVAWTQSSLAYVVLYSLLIFVFFAATLLEIALRKGQIAKQVKSIYGRFIRCEKAEEKVVVSKYEGGREKVRQFTKNLLYKKAIARKEIEMSVAIGT